MQKHNSDSLTAKTVKIFSFVDRKRGLYCTYSLRLKALATTKKHLILKMNDIEKSCFLFFFNQGCWSSNTINVLCHNSTNHTTYDWLYDSDKKHPKRHFKYFLSLSQMSQIVGFLQTRHLQSENTQTSYMTPHVWKHQTSRFPPENTSSYTQLRKIAIYHLHHKTCFCDDSGNAGWCIIWLTQSHSEENYASLLMKSVVMKCGHPLIQLQCLTPAGGGVEGGRRGWMIGLYPLYCYTCPAPSWSLQTDLPDRP